MVGIPNLLGNRLEIFVQELEGEAGERYGLPAFGIGLDHLDARGDEVVIDDVM